MDVAANGTILFPNQVTFSVPPIGAGSGVPVQTAFIFTQQVTVDSTIPAPDPGALITAFGTWTAPRTGIYMIEYSTNYNVGSVTGGPQDGWQYKLYQGGGIGNQIALANLTHQIGTTLPTYASTAHTVIYVSLTAGQSYHANIDSWNISGTYATSANWYGSMNVSALC